MYVMGLDGGGSRLRVVVAAPDLTVLAVSEGGSANPNSAGRDAAAQAIRETIGAALAQARLTPADVQAVGAGIAGTRTAPDWVRETVAAVLPDAAIRVASDVEIALIGAHGARRGVLILAGTGSVALGINAAGTSVQVGGWGYLLGDEGSGYWLGLKALQAVVRADDGREPPTALTALVLEHLHLADASGLIQWLYTPGRTRDVAGLAPLVLAATGSDETARRIVAGSVDELALAARTVIRRLALESPAIAFAGGLLSEANPLSLGLCAALGLSELPTPLHPPVIGAALLALLP